MKQRPRRSGGIRIAIYNTSSGFVSPSPECITYSVSIFDGDMERAIAEKAQTEALAAGNYVAKWADEHCNVIEYLFSVRVETAATHHVEVMP